MSTIGHSAPAATAATGVTRSALGSGHLSHGTLESRDLDVAYKLYQDLLALRIVRHGGALGQMVAGRGDIGVVCIRRAVGLQDQGEENRWVIAASSAEAVAQAHDRAAGDLAGWRIAELRALTRDESGTAFRFRDFDGNWWEVTDRTPDYYEALFKRGDVPA